jgi:hypothetical protein
MLTQLGDQWADEYHNSSAMQSDKTVFETKENEAAKTFRD